MPLHKSSSRASRLDPTMISAPLDDFRHTMHIGRGGDAFGDTSFLSTLGPSPPTSNPAPVDHEPFYQEPPTSEDPEYCESASSFALDLDLDLGPSMLGDVLGVMDGLGLDTFQPEGDPSSPVKPQHQNLPNGTGENQTGDGGIKAKRPKVRFSDKRDEIIRRPSEEDQDQDQDQGQDYQDREPVESPSPCEEDPPSPAATHGSDYHALDRRRPRNGQSETDSEDEEEGGRGYTFEDEFDDEIGL
ncbi:cdc42 effector protein 5 isoform X2 [Nerophis ophidion]|nr:cdc42 effector protein 5 isoform X2 [Nerophis ophidion]